METRLIEYILAIYDEKNISRAAQKMYITPSAMTQQLHKLEKELGTPLFMRCDNVLVPTKAGRIYLSGARTVLETVQAAEKQLLDIRTTSTDTSIRIAFHRTYLPFFESVLLPMFQKKQPFTRLLPIVPDGQSIKSVIQHKKADIGILITPQPSSMSLEYLIIRREELHLAYPAHLAADNHSFSKLIDSISDIGFIMPPENAFFSTTATHYLRNAGIHLHTVAQAASLTDLLDLLNHQFACSLLPETIVRSKDRFCHSPLVPDASYYLGLAYNKSLAITPALRELILLLLQLFDREYGNQDILSALQIDRC